MMRLDWLEDILAVAETGSFHEAAERRRLTQSAFSRRIRSIEDHLGVELFDRTRKPVQLHPAVQDQRDTIARLAGQLRQLGADLRRGTQASARRLDIVSQHALSAALTPALVQDIQARSADIFLRLRSADLDDCFAQLLARQAEIALVYRLPGSDHPVRADFVQVAVIGTDRLIPVIAADRAAALRAGMAAGDLPHVAYPPQVFLGQVQESRLLAPLRDRLAPRARAETALTLAALEMAATGLAVAWVPLSLARAGLAAGRLADLTAGLPDSALPDCLLEITAVRVAGPPTAVEAEVWDRLCALPPQAIAERTAAPDGGAA